MMIKITEQEAIAIIDFIDNTLDRFWDHYTDRYITSDDNETGKRRMDPTMYEMMETLRNRLNEEE